MENGTLPEDCGCQLFVGCDLHPAARDLGEALQAAAVSLGEWITLANEDPWDYFRRDATGQKIVAALEKAGLRMP